MALNRKYAALPDLDSAPDIYETPSLTDDASSTVVSTVADDIDDFSPETANISRRRLDADSARHVFEGSVVDARHVDFSDRVSGKRKSYVVSSKRGDEDEDRDKEGLERRIERLRREVEECRAEAERGRQESHAMGNEADHVSEVERLGQVLEGIVIEEEGGLKAPGRLRSALSSTASGVAHSTTTGDMGDAGDAARATYTVTYAPSFRNDHDQAKAAAFDERLALLERALGISSSTIPALSTNGHPIAVLPSLDSLQRQMSILLESSPASLDAISRRVKTLTEEANRLEESRKAARRAKEELESVGGPISTLDVDEPDTEHVAKINALYGTLPTIERLSPLLPPLLDRLRSLRTIHADAAVVHESMEHAMRTQEGMTLDIKKWKEGLDKVEEAIVRSEKTMGGNVETVEGWLKDLEEKCRRLEA